MWEKLQNAAQHPAAQFVRKICGDPVQLYAVLLMTSIMHYYHSGMNWLYTLLSVFLTLGLMKFYDFVAKHRFIGPLCYLAFLMLGLGGVFLLTEIGYMNYPIYFMVWFLTPQSVVEFSGWYTVAIYLLMTGFLSSAVYYFAKVRYRMVMQFLIMLIPLSFYAKEGIQMPALLVIFLLASYFLLMVYCRQLRETEEIRRIRSFYSSMSITVYVLAFSIAAAVVPKPAIHADREFIENAMAYSTLSDVLMEAISMFTDSTDNSAMLTSNSRTIYHARSSESLRLRTQTYTFYLEDDSWNKTENYDYPDHDYTEEDFYRPQDLQQAIADAAAADTEFAAEYGLTEIAGIILPEQSVQGLAVLTNMRGTNVIPIPTRIASLRGSRAADTMISEHGALTPKERTYGFRDTFYLDYYSDTYARYEQSERILQALRQDTYHALLLDAAGILHDSDPEAAALLEACAEEQEEAMDYLALCEKMDYQSEVVDALAAEITAGLSSDIEKARAIERYFEEMDYTYDLSYRKEAGDNVDTFLTQSHKGVCYEYATAMVLLARSSGLPTRYVQGYNMSEMYENEVNSIETNYVIKVRDAHGFPEVYISGYGWLSFEPTVAMDMELQEDTAENYYVMLWGLVLFGLVLLAIGMYFLLPLLREKLFRRRLPRMNAAEAASAVFRRMRILLGLPESTTVQELAQASGRFADPAADIFRSMDAFLYDNAQDGMTALQFRDAYAAWHSAWTAYLKAERQKEKMERKQKRSAKK